MVRETSTVSFFVYERVLRLGTKHGAGKRSTCVICTVEFPSRGRQKSCSAECSKALRESKRQSSLPSNRSSKLCTDTSSKTYILDRIAKDELSGCWVWQKSLNPKTGYGQVAGYPYTAHRLSYLLWKGDLGDLLVRHRCHNKMCCNPDHLMSGTDLDNYHDSAEAHFETSVKRRGLPAKNRIAVVVNGFSYSSKVDAMKQLKVSPKTLAKMIESEQRSEAA